MSLLSTHFAVHKRRWGGVVLVAILIFYFSIIATPSVSASRPWQFGDKLLHFGAYAGLTVVLFYATSAMVRPLYRHLFIFGTVIAFGFGMEILQGPLAPRHFSYYDLLADISGSVLAIIVCHSARKTRERFQNG